MLKQLLLLSVAFAVLTGCAAMESSRNVEENVFTSSYPKLHVKVSPSLIYLENIGKAGPAETVTGMRGSRSVDNYIFIEPKGKKVTRALAIQFYNVPTHFISDFYRNKEDALQYFKTDIGGREYTCYTEAVYPSMKSQITKMINEKGYSMECGLSHCAGRRVGAKNNYLAVFLYYEDLAGSGFTCKQYSGDWMLNEKQVQYLERFNQRFRSSFEILSQQL